SHGSPCGTDVVEILERVCKKVGFQATIRVERIRVLVARSRPVGLSARCHARLLTTRFHRQVTMDMIWKLSAERVAASQSRLTVLLCVRRGARVTQETGGAISLFRRTSRAGIGMGTDDLTFTRLQFMDQ